MVIAESDDSNDENDRKVEGSAFVSAQRGVDGQTRGAGGAVRFSKNTKRAREEENAMDIDDERPKKDGGVKVKDKAELAKDRRQRKMKARLGEEFRAKVGLRLCRI